MTIIQFVTRQVFPFCKVTKLVNHTCTCEEQTEKNISNNKTQLKILNTSDNILIIRKQLLLMRACLCVWLPYALSSRVNVRTWVYLVKCVPVGAVCLCVRVCAVCLCVRVCAVYVNVRRWVHSWVCSRASVCFDNLQYPMPPTSISKKIIPHLKCMAGKWRKVRYSNERLGSSIAFSKIQKETNPANQFKIN